ncbi:hypothetical protein OROMI_026010 [Orobanche minor]
MQPSTNILVPTNNPTKKINNNNNNRNNTALNAAHHHRNHGSTAQACAACKYQRRKCAADCILAPYFPHDRQPQFLNAHRLFGVSNIVKIVRHLDPPAKDHAMRTIIFQSDARAADPVGGCYRIIRDLEHQISLARAELDIILHHLALCRAAAARPQIGPADEVALMDDVNSCWSTCMQYGGNVNSNNNTHADSTTSSSFPPPPPHTNTINDNDDDNINNNQMKGLSMEDCHHDDQMRSILDHLSAGDDDETRPADDEDHYNFDSNGEILITSSNGILTEESEDDDGPFSYIQDHHHDLKAAAPTFFTLTNCDI